MLLYLVSHRPVLNKVYVFMALLVRQTSRSAATQILLLFIAFI